MPLYSFDPISFPPSPAAGPGTDFHDLAANILNGVDDADLALSSSIAQMLLSIPGDLADLADLGTAWDAAAIDLADQIAETEADDLTSFILAALDQDSSLDSLADDVLTGLSLIPTSILEDVLGYVFGGLYSQISSIVNDDIQSFLWELDQIENELNQMLSFGNPFYG